MVVVQIIPSANVSSVEIGKEINACFNNNILNLTKDFDEFIVLFDTYRVDSLKEQDKAKETERE